MVIQELWCIKNDRYEIHFFLKFNKISNRNGFKISNVVKLSENVISFPQY